jgi:hypothetical protein
VIVTRFECGRLMAMVLILLLHRRVKRDVRRHARGFVGIVLLRDWRARTVLSISLWRDIESVYSMGGVARHIHAARIPSRLGVRTRCGVFCFAGDWRQVMFGVPVEAVSPLVPVAAQHQFIDPQLITDPQERSPDGDSH